jgi:hypothetical protein
VCGEPNAEGKHRGLNAAAEKLRAELEVRQKEIAAMQGKVAKLRAKLVATAA